MRMLKCYLANDKSGHFVTTKEAINRGGGMLTCVSCGCRLILHAGVPGVAPWFEHDQQTVSRATLMNCANLDPQVKAEARQEALRKAVKGLPVPAVVKSWYCVWCRDHYLGEKHCIECGTGIYSIEEAQWWENYT
ncbi:MULTISPECIES: putative zinc ribbon protein [unclassified Serratia (in: enterobacteria)]|uniref:putative zinc ribbon protein n=1 Tax=unclassified Serratia (in: enterobacteria) TaxID=2647522 RepID=UPI003075F08B